MKEEQKRVNNQKSATPTYGANLSPVSAQKKAQMTQITQPAAQYTIGVNPGSYKSRYQGALDSIMQTLQNPDEFRYEFNGDELFKSYADQYTQRGKQAMLDTMGQAAGMTGGYGNSYAQQVGQQAYQNYLQDLYDRGFDMRNTAYQSYRDQLADLQNLYNNYSAAEAQDYGRYQDAYNAYEAQRQYELQQEQLRLQREQWEWQKAQAEAAAAAAASSGGGGGNGGGSGKQYYAWDGKVYEKDSKTGKYSVADTSKITSKDRIDDTTVQAQLDHRRKNLGR
jgi:hypothetical protein